MTDRAVQAELMGRARTSEQGVLSDRLAEHFRVAQHVADIVGHLIGLAQAVAEHAPGIRVGACRLSTGGGGGGKERTGFGTLVIGQGHTGLALPGLPGNDAKRHAGALGDGGQQRREAQGRLASSGGQRLKRHDDQRVAGQHGQRLAEGGLHRGAAAAGGGIVETGQIVMDQRGTVHQL